MTDSILVEQIPDEQLLAGLVHAEEVPHEPVSDENLRVGSMGDEAERSNHLQGRGIGKLSLLVEREPVRKTGTCPQKPMSELDHRHFLRMVPPL